MTILRNELATALQGSHIGDLERIRVELRSTVSLGTGHKIEVDRLAPSAKGESNSARLAQQKPKQQHELLLLKHAKKAKLDGDLQGARLQSSMVTTLEDELEQ